MTTAVPIRSYRYTSITSDDIARVYNETILNGSISDTSSWVITGFPGATISANISYPNWIYNYQYSVGTKDSRFKKHKLKLTEGDESWTCQKSTTLLKKSHKQWRDILSKLLK